MICISIRQLVTADPSLGRLDYDSMTQQALMEIAIGEFSEKSQEKFKDENGNFGDIRDWEGVQVDANKSVEVLEWHSSTRIGHKSENHGTIRLGWIPKTVQTILLMNRGLEGELDCAKLPKALRQLEVDRNRLTGSVEFAALPSGLQSFHANDNLLSGTIDLTQIPSSVWSVTLGGNLLTGSIDLTELPGSLSVLVLSRNQLTGDVDFRELSENLESVFLHGNAFEGTLFAGSYIPDALQDWTFYGNDFRAFHFEDEEFPKKCENELWDTQVNAFISSIAGGIPLEVFQMNEETGVPYF
mmetsp:Transcript_2619/g.4035  ORF Transcript_2619/g.4035 Transcript_2619/m.4035 type:complete len:299 (-) Transcript_2619:86-982(-)